MYNPEKGDDTNMLSLQKYSASEKNSEYLHKNLTRCIMMVHHKHVELSSYGVKSAFVWSFS
jgi:hypothetical protein